MSNGLFQKYEVKKADGTPLDPNADYFVLRLDTDPAARIAALTYADAVGEDMNNWDLSDDLRRRVEEHSVYHVDFSQRDLNHHRLAIWWMSKREATDLRYGARYHIVRWPDYLRKFYPESPKKKLLVPAPFTVRGVRWLSEDTAIAKQCAELYGVVFHREELNFVKMIRTGFVTALKTGDRLDRR